MKRAFLCFLILISIGVITSCSLTDSDEVIPDDTTVLVSDDKGSVEGEDDPCIGGC